MTDPIDLFPVIHLTNGLCLVACVNREGGIEAMHRVPISHAAAVAMKAELTAERSCSYAYEEIAAVFELRARIADCLTNCNLSGEQLDAVCTALECRKPWEDCHRPPANDAIGSTYLDDEQPF